ncbi:hypothetical protein [Pelagicoccus mobilis]|uniref:Uncharacterized protein n=1 Tax=Pelagicoccus mobilis TaxID=415221 RepID=A0A934S1F8_9BACT|nr:hypothetical protein [Pelagicoccus mobilis]MBK1877353.1 hypothetical protein [Pelagicoccus mobilis]
MNSLPSTAILAALLALSPQAICEVVNTHIDLAVSQHEVEHSISFSTGGSARANPSLQTRYMSAWVEWDDETLEPISVRFHTTSIVVYGGILWEDWALSVDTRLKPPNAPAFDSTWKFSTKDVIVNIGPQDSSLAVNQQNGEFDAELYIYRGTASVEFKGNGESISESGDYSDSITTLSLSQTPRIRIEKLVDNLMVDKYLFHFDFEFKEETNETSSELGTTLNGIDEGSFTLTGQHSSPSEFANWFSRTGDEFPSHERGTVSNKGIPIELSYALNLSPNLGDTHTYPFNWRTSAGKRKLDIYSDTLNADIIIEYSTNLQAGSWKEIPESWIENGPESLKAGSNHDVAIEIPAAEKSVFIRVRPEV